MATSYEQMEINRFPAYTEFSFDRNILRRLQVGEANIELAGSTRTIVDSYNSVYGVIDERTSSIATGKVAETVKNSFSNALSNFDSSDSESSMRHALEAAQESVRYVMQANDSRNVGVSGSFVKFFRDGSALKAAYAHVGDSRILLRSGSEVRQITEDEGDISGLTHGFGHESFSPVQVGVITLRPHDRVVLMNADVIGDTDDENLTADDMNRVMNEPYAQEAARMLVDTSKKEADKAVIVIDVPQPSRAASMSEKVLGFLGLQRRQVAHETPAAVVRNYPPRPSNSRGSSTSGYFDDKRSQRQDEYVAPTVVGNPDDRDIDDDQSDVIITPVDNDERGGVRGVFDDQRSVGSVFDEPVVVGGAPQFRTYNQTIDDRSVTTRESVDSYRKRRRMRNGLIAAGLLVGGYVIGEATIADFGDGKDKGIDVMPWPGDGFDFNAWNGSTTLSDDPADMTKLHTKEGFDILPPFLDGDWFNVWPGGSANNDGTVDAPDADVDTSEGNVLDDDATDTELDNDVEVENEPDPEPIEVRVILEWPDEPMPQPEQPNITVNVPPAPAPESAPVTPPLPPPAPVPAWVPDAFYVDPGSGYIKEIHEMGHYLVGQKFSSNNALSIYNNARFFFGDQLIELPGHEGFDSYANQNGLYISAPGQAHWATAEIEAFIRASILEAA